VLTEESVRRNFLLLYELLDEVPYAHTHTHTLLYQLLDEVPTPYTLDLYVETLDLYVAPKALSRERPSLHL
jgi:hypothetical protein